MSVAVSVRLPESLAKELDHIVAETERSRSFLIQKALEAYIEDFADLQIALERLRDQKDPVISDRDLRKSLGL
ncbi:MAG: ribbon-helix-helix protein, CopG family [Candidatus Sumerlaeota bacterium]|nr:ribbon-helix-helix protein, CopG family [Candidatus Sumerlaeota bacterium]